jgi:hypothetical protein
MPVVMAVMMSGSYVGVSNTNSGRKNLFRPTLPKRHILLLRLRKTISLALGRISCMVRHLFMGPVP